MCTLYCVMAVSSRSIVCVFSMASITILLMLALATGCCWTDSGDSQPSTSTTEGIQDTAGRSIIHDYDLGINEIMSCIIY